MVTAKDVKELRERTGAGMMDCKKALTECDGDMDKAIDWLREKGIAKAAKKSDRIAAEGLTRVGVEGNTAVIFEVNSETDFVAKNEQFLKLLDDIKTALFAAKPATLEEALSASCNGSTIADELTNNLDLYNIETLTNMLNKYSGTLIVISHDSEFAQRLSLSKEIIL